MFPWVIYFPAVLFCSRALGSEMCLLNAQTNPFHIGLGTADGAGAAKASGVGNGLWEAQKWRWVLGGHHSGLSECPRPGGECVLPQSAQLGLEQGARSPLGEGPRLSSLNALPKAGGPRQRSRPSGNCPLPVLS